MKPLPLNYIEACDWMEIPEIHRRDPYEVGSFIGAVSTTAYDFEGMDAENWQRYSDIICRYWIKEQHRIKIELDVYFFNCLMGWLFASVMAFCFIWVLFKRN